MNKPNYSTENYNYQNPAETSAKLLKRTGLEGSRFEVASKNILERYSDLPPEVQEHIRNAMGAIATEMGKLDTPEK